MRDQPVPEVGHADVERVLARDYPPAARPEARQRLGDLPDECGPRTRLAVLKLAQGDLARLAEAVAVAQRDWRDVIAAAEYPVDALLPVSATASAHEVAYEADWQQYQVWLHAQASA